MRWAGPLPSRSTEPRRRRAGDDRAHLADDRRSQIVRYDDRFDGLEELHGARRGPGRGPPGSSCVEPSSASSTANTLAMIRRNASVVTQKPAGTRMPSIRESHRGSRPCRRRRDMRLVDPLESQTSQPIRPPFPQPTWASLIPYCRSRRTPVGRLVACIVSTPGVLAARPPPGCTLVVAGRMNWLPGRAVTARRL